MPRRRRNNNEISDSELRRLEESINNLRDTPFILNSYYGVTHEGVIPNNQTTEEANNLIHYDDNLNIRWASQNYVTTELDSIRNSINQTNYNIIYFNSQLNNLGTNILGLITNIIASLESHNIPIMSIPLTEEEINEPSYIRLDTLPDYDPRIRNNDQLLRANLNGVIQITNHNFQIVINHINEVSRSILLILNSVVGTLTNHSINNINFDDYINTDNIQATVSTQVSNNHTSETTNNEISLHAHQIEDLTRMYNELLFKYDQALNNIRTLERRLNNGGR